jgi:hypothetical protein
MITKKAPRRFWNFFVILAILAAFVLFFVAPPAPQEVHRAAADPLVLKGALHIHTLRSDGGGTTDDVAAAAAQAGLRFVVITDHGDGRGIDPPTYRSGVLCIDGAEISTEDGHVVAIGMKPAGYRLAGEARDVIDDVHRLGGIAVAAHPTSPKPELTFSAWNAPFDGIEWLNADSEWRDERLPALARTVLGYPLRPAAALARTFDRPAALARADEVASRRDIAILAGHDAHARIARADGHGYARRGIPLPSYRAVFESFAVRVVLDAALTGNAESDAATVTRALRHGRVFTAIDGLARRAMLAFTARSGGATVSTGGSVIPSGTVEFDVRAAAPQDGRIVLLHDGREVASAAAPRLQQQLPPRPGAYRVEVHVPGAPGSPPVPWILSSPIYVGLRPADLPPVAYGPAVPITNQDWGFEHAELSSGVLSESPDGVELTYTLGGEGTSPFAALAHRVSVPADARALSFSARADRPMRVSVQLRSPAGGGEGQRWGRSVFLDSTDRHITLPLDEFRAVADTNTVIPRDRIDSLLLVVDSVNTDPGAMGRVFVGGFAWLP